MRVLDAAHGAGVNTIGVMTDPPLTQQAAAEGEAAPPAAPQ
jgi:biopolymer transport protein ExbD